MEPIKQVIGTKDATAILGYLETHKPSQKLQEIPRYVRNEFKRIPGCGENLTDKRGVIIYSSAQAGLEIWYVEDGSFLFRQIDPGTGSIDFYPKRRRVYYLAPESAGYDRALASQNLERFIRECGDHVRREKEAHQRSLFLAPHLQKDPSTMTLDERCELSERIRPW